MKDVQGVMRGKCNKDDCDCREFMTSSEGRVRCEYCDHTPVEHVRIIELGECLSSQCNGTNCPKYMSDSPTEYTACAYCECEASFHRGADALRKSKRPPTTTPAAPPTATPSATCIFPGCPFPKRVEGHKTHDFCSRTCANKYQSLLNQAAMTTGGGATGPPPPATSSASAPPASKPANICIAPGCTWPKFVEGTKVHEYCSKRCSQSGPQGIPTSQQNVTGLTFTPASGQPVAQPPINSAGTGPMAPPPAVKPPGS